MDIVTVMMAISVVGWRALNSVSSFPSGLRRANGGNRRFNARRWEHMRFDLGRRLSA